MSELRGSFGASAYGGGGCALWNSWLAVLGGPRGGPGPVTGAGSALAFATCFPSLLSQF